MKRLRYRPLDYLVILLSLAAIALSFAKIRRTAETAPRLVITAGKTEYIYVLDKDRTIPVSGEMGESVIRIEGGEARFVSSPCTNKQCIHAGALRKNGDFAACLPNKVIAHIESQ